MSELSRSDARRVIETIGSSGTPPIWGFQNFTVGLEPYLDILESDYLEEYLAEGGATFKLLVGTYGGGKTHFLYSLRALGWQHGYPVAYVPLSADESPFHRLDRVYAALVRSLMLPVGSSKDLKDSERGFLPILKIWMERLREEVRSEGVAKGEQLDEIIRRAARRVEGIESLQMQKALVQALEALGRGRSDDLSELLQWLSAQGYSRTTHRRFGLLHGINKSVALQMLRSLSQWIRVVGFPGLCVLFDEAEQVPSLSTKQRDALLSNLRELIDECGHHHFQGVMMVYAVPDETFFEGRSSVYEALNQRIASVFEVFNPTGVKIRLDELGLEPLPLLHQLGVRLAEVYRIAYRCKVPAADAAVESVARAAYEQRFGDIGYKRLFVQAWIRALHLLRAGAATEIDIEQARKLVQ
jgi:hypothetical protein